MKTEKCKELVPGILQQTEKMFWIKCCVKGTWHYCSNTRLDKLVAKKGSVEEVGRTYISRVAKAELKAKAAQAAAAAVAEATKAPAQPEVVPQVTESEPAPEVPAEQVAESEPAPEVPAEQVTEQVEA